MEKCTPLFNYLVQRLFDSFTAVPSDPLEINDAKKYIDWIQTPGHDVTISFYGWGLMSTLIVERRLFTPAGVTCVPKSLSEVRDLGKSFRAESVMPLIKLRSSEIRDWGKSLMAASVNSWSYSRLREVRDLGRSLIATSGMPAEPVLMSAAQPQSQHVPQMGLGSSSR